MSLTGLITGKAGFAQFAHFFNYIREFFFDQVSHDKMRVKLILKESMLIDDFAHI